MLGTSILKAENVDTYKTVLEYLIQVGVTEKTSGIAYIADILYLLFNEDERKTTTDKETMKMFELRLQGYTIDEIAKMFGVHSYLVQKKLKLNGQYVKFNLNGRIYENLAETYSQSSRNIKRAVNYAVTKLYEKQEHTDLYNRLFGTEKLTDKVFIKRSYLYLKEKGV